MHSHTHTHTVSVSDTCSTTMIADILKAAATGNVYLDLLVVLPIKLLPFFEDEMSKWFEYIYFSVCCVSQWLSFYLSWRQKSPIPKLHLNAWGLLEHIEAWSSSPRQLMWKENFINSISKRKTLPISGLSFLASGLKGISRALLSSGVSSVDLSWIRGDCDASAQRKVDFQQLGNQWWQSLMHVIYQWCGARS